MKSTHIHYICQVQQKDHFVVILITSLNQCGSDLTLIWSAVCSHDDDDYCAGAMFLCMCGDKLQIAI